MDVIQLSACKYIIAQILSYCFDLMVSIYLKTKKNTTTICNVYRYFYKDANVINIILL